MVARGLSAGFTLVELMIVVLIIGLLAVMAGPFTSAWTDSANVHKAQGLLDQAVRHARAVALRNGANAQGDAPAARLFFDTDDQRIKVCQNLTDASCREVWWSVEIPSGVELDIPSGTVIDLTNRGMPAQPATIILSQGDESHAYRLF